MLSDNGQVEFFFLKDFHDMRCKYDRVLSVIRQQMNREPRFGEAYIMMSRNQRTVRIYRYDEKSCMLHEKRFHPGYTLMRVEWEDDRQVFRINWRDVSRILNCPVMKVRNLRK